MSRAVTICLPEGGESVALLGDEYRFIVTSRETEGKYALVEATVWPGGGPPPHTHSHEEEGFFVLEGEVTFQLDNETLKVGAGGFINMPIGSLHSFRNETETAARMLITIAPAGLEEMFLKVAAPLPPNQKPPPPSQDEIDRLLELAPKYGIDLRVGGQ